MALERIDRRMFLRGVGTVVGLPLLEAMLPARAFAWAEDDVAPKRLVAICTGLGIHAEHLFPEQSGRGYEMTPYLSELEKFREKFTVFSGLSHPDVDGGHSSEACFLTAAAHPGQSSFRNSISLDQYALERLSPDTRFGSLQLTSAGGNFSISFTRSGVMIPAESRPSRMFRRLFVDGNEREVAEQTRRIDEGRSVMDEVMADAAALDRRVGAADRAKLSEYYDAVRDVELRLQRARAWAERPKPRVDAEEPVDIADQTDIIGRTRLLFELAHLALQTDSTRLITVTLTGHNSVPPIEGVTIDWHNLSHHGKDETKLDQLKIIELEQMRQVAGLLGRLDGTAEAGGTLLDRTMVMYGSNLGSGSSHDTKNMPIVLAGGGFGHGAHVAYDRQRNGVLCELYVSMLQRLGVEADRFGSGARRLGWEGEV